AGEVIAASLTGAGTKSVEAAAWKTALDPSGGWVPHVIAAMDERITHLREIGMTDAAGMVLASDQDDARAYAKVVRKITGQAPALILSDDPAASKRIEAFRTSDQRIAVCVRMISEGVDIPRAACLAWMTSYRTPLFFAQAVGRVVRARAAGESATVFLPAVRPLVALAAELELDRNHVMAPPPPADDSDVDPLDLPAPAERDLVPAMVTLDSEAEFAHVMHSGRAVTASADAAVGDGGRSQWAAGPVGSVGSVTAEDEAFLGLPGLLSPEQTAALLSRRDAHLRRRVDAVGRLRSGGPDGADYADGSGGSGSSGSTDGDDPSESEMTGWRAAAALRREVNQLVARVAARTGAPHAKLHSQIRRAVPGPASAAAGPDILEQRRDHLLGLL
ncbi:MAG TPA: helicase-related protein, partial [Nakamurella sp.]